MPVDAKLRHCAPRPGGGSGPNVPRQKWASSRSWCADLWHRTRSGSGSQGCSKVYQTIPCLTGFARQAIARRPKGGIFTGAASTKSMILVDRGGAIPWSDGWSLHARILPYLEQEQGFNAFNFHVT